MAKIAYILLCHKDAEATIQQAEGLTSAGDCIAIHFDASADAQAYKQITESLAGNPNVTFAKRVKCGWGEWSLIQGSLNAMIAADQAFPDVTHFYMVSGDCMAIKPASYTHRFLDENDVDFIENNDFFESDWIKTGMKEDRLHYRHFFNERTNKMLFYNSYRLQKALGFMRDVPKGLEIKIGSQWWCLRRCTVEAVLQFVKKRSDVVRFFKTTWIPDETFFQTVVMHLVPKDEVINRTLTFLMFSDYGMPVSFFNDQYDFLLSQDSLFARKISPQAHDLKEKLGKLYSGGDVPLNVTNEGRMLYKFLTTRGREGRRFSGRFWERESTIGREREVLILVCKKWHVAKRFLHAAQQVSGIKGFAYLFDEEDTSLPEMGGTERTLEKRARHRRAVMRLLFERAFTDRLMICSDPANVDLLEDFQSDRCTTRMLELVCSFDYTYLRGHAIRTGLAGHNSAEDTLRRIVPTIRMDFLHESNAMRDRNYPNFHAISDRNTPEDNVRQISAFLDITRDKAREIAQTPYLFAD
jgi:hypothetical protein